MRESITAPSILLQHYKEMNGQLHAMTFFTWLVKYYCI